MAIAEQLDPVDIMARVNALGEPVALRDVCTPTITRPWQPGSTRTLETA